MPRRSEDVLDFQQLREMLRGKTTCAPGRRAIDALEFSTDRAALGSAFALIGEAQAYRTDGLDMGFGSLADPEPWLATLEVPGAVLTPALLLDAATLADAAAAVCDLLHDKTGAGSRTFAAQFPLLASKIDGLTDLRPLAVAVRRAILPNGEISDDASTALKNIRVTMARTRESVQKTLQRILHTRGDTDQYVTRRNDRFVIPVPASERRQIQGIVHAASATGQTVFVEPLETVEMNNRLVQLAEDESAEIARILEELTERWRAHWGPALAASETIAEIDGVFARARFAAEFNCALPQFTSNAALELAGARHPVLEANLRKQGRSIVPITLALGASGPTDTDIDTVLVISGPNTGGKTVALKTIGLAALAAQYGLPVAAQTARLPLFDRVLVDIGDEQSIAADLSTFSAHMLNVRAMLEAATSQSLVLLDELGTGTAPEEGAALGIALLEEFRARQCLTLATTHHDRLKAYASTTPGVVNAAVEFDEVNLRPTYRLMVGMPGGSSGIEIARRLGLPDDLINRARSELSPESREATELIARLHQSRAELEDLQRETQRQAQELAQEKKKLQTEWTARQRTRLKELELQFTEAIEKHEKETARAVAAVKERELRVQLDRQTQRQLVKARGQAREEADAATVAHLSESQADLGTASAPPRKPVSAEELVPGARVQVRGLPGAVTLRRRDSASAEIEAGALRMKIPIADIIAVVASPPPSSTLRPSAARPVPARVAEPVASEINVIGCTVEEATGRVDKFLDQSTLAGSSQVRVIHGHGTGALRRGLAEFLKTHPLVASIHSETEERGGAAVTVVELKD